MLARAFRVRGEEGDEISPRPCISRSSSPHGVGCPRVQSPVLLTAVGTPTSTVFTRASRSSVLMTSFGARVVGIGFIKNMVP